MNTLNELLSMLDNHQDNKVRELVELVKTLQDDFDLIAADLTPKEDCEGLFEQFSGDLLGWNLPRNYNECITIKTLFTH